MRNLLCLATTPLVLAASTSALAGEPTDPPGALIINATATLVSDYRFRGISQTDRNFAVQGSLTLTHRSGFYVSAWGSSIDDYVSQGADQEIDLIAGFRHSITSGATLDIGVLYYWYPKSGAGNTDFVEPYASLTHIIGPATAKLTVNYAPKQKSLALNQVGPAKDNLYLSGDVSVGVTGTLFTLTGHLGHNFGPSYLVPSSNGYTDWSIGAAMTYKTLSLGVAYVDTDTSFRPITRDVAAAGVVASLGVSF